MSKEELWRRTARALEFGDFSLLDELLTNENASIVDLVEANGNPVEHMGEAFAWACFTGRTAEAAALLDKGVDPAESIKTGLAGFHWAVNRGNVETTKMLIERGAPLEQLNMYGGTVLNCALYSAVHEFRPTHAEIIEMLIEAGAKVDPQAAEWWEKQPVPDDETKQIVADLLRRIIGRRR